MTKNDVQYGAYMLPKIHCQCHLSPDSYATMHDFVNCELNDIMCLFLKILYDLGRVHFYQQNYEKADSSFAACKNLMSKVRFLIVHFFTYNCQYTVIHKIEMLDI